MEIIEFKGIQFQLTNDPAADGAWIEAWYDLSNGDCAVQKFVVLESGQPDYNLINEALEYFGREVLRGQLNSMQMSSEFAARYLYPAIVKHHQQARWN